MNKMPKIAQSPSYKLRNLVERFGSDSFSADDKSLHCKLCGVRVNGAKKYCVDQHIQTKKHQCAVLLRNKKKEQTITNFTTEPITKIEFFPEEENTDPLLDNKELSLDVTTPTCSQSPFLLTHSQQTKKKNYQRTERDDGDEHPTTNESFKDQNERFDDVTTPTYSQSAILKKKQNQRTDLEHKLTNEPPVDEYELFGANVASELRQLQNLKEIQLKLKTDILRDILAANIAVDVQRQALRASTPVRILNSVKKHPCIWNRLSADYADHNKLDRAWREVAKEVGKDDKLCRDIWLKKRSVMDYNSSNPFEERTDFVGICKQSQVENNAHTTDRSEEVSVPNRGFEQLTAETETELINFFRGNINDIISLKQSNQRVFKRKMLELIDELHKHD